MGPKKVLRPQSLSEWEVCCIYLVCLLIDSSCFQVVHLVVVVVVFRVVYLILLIAGAMPTTEAFARACDSCRFHNRV